MRISFFTKDDGADIYCDIDGIGRIIAELDGMDKPTESVIEMREYGQEGGRRGSMHFILLDDAREFPPRYVLNVETLKDDLHITFSREGLECFLRSLNLILRKLQRNENEHEHFYAKAWGIGVSELTDFSFVNGGSVINMLTVYGQTAGE